MPPDQLTNADDTVPAVLDVLAGTSLTDAAAHVGMEPTDLAAAVEVYHLAGRHALHEQAATPDWWQIYLQFTHWGSAEKTAADDLAPLMQQAETDGTLTAWWFIRKHPCWRLRLHTPPHSSVKSSLCAALDDLATAGRLHRWWPGIYEPETAAFGGSVGMTCAHDLFHADSRAILNLHRRHSPLGRRELSLLLCTIMMRAAGLEWYEMGDVWHRVAAERRLPTDIPPDRLRAMADDLRHLIRADTTPDGPMLGPDGPIAFAAGWAHAFHETGRTLGTAARAGTLDRGLRLVLAYHVIFHWNRLGLTARAQSILATAARTAILNPPTPRVTAKP